MTKDNELFTNGWANAIWAVLGRFAQLLVVAAVLGGLYLLVRFVHWAWFN